MDRERTDLIIEAANAEIGRWKSKQDPPNFQTLQIPTARYTDPRLWDLEQKHLWDHTWLFTCCASDVPNPGDFKVVERVRGASVIIVRGEDGEVRAFFNVCRHRGGRVVAHGCSTGHSRSLPCQFHGWTYDLTGRLRTVPGEQEFPGLGRDQIGLEELRCETLGNLVFTNRDQAAPPLREWLGPVYDQVQDLGMDTRKVFHEDNHIIKCNWKIGHEAFVESYHLLYTHRNSVATWVDHRGGHIELYPNGHSVQFQPMRRGSGHDEGNALALEGSEAGRINRETARQYTIFPNFQMSVSEFEFAITMYWPIDQTTMRFQVLYTGPEGYDSVEGPGAQTLISMLTPAIREDIENLEPIQLSLDSQVNPFHRMGWLERRCYHFEEEVDRTIGVENIPADLRVDQELAPHVTRTESASVGTPS